MRPRGANLAASSRNTVASKTGVIVIGSGIGGLCCAGLLRAWRQGGGGAGGPQQARRCGPRFWQDLPLRIGSFALEWLGPLAQQQPLAQILRALGQELEVIEYRDWDVLFPEGHLRIGVGNADFEAVVQQLRGPEAVAEWQRFMQVLQPIAAAADALPLLRCALELM